MTQLLLEARVREHLDAVILQFFPQQDLAVSFDQMHAQLVRSKPSRVSAKA